MTQTYEEAFAKDLGYTLLPGEADSVARDISTFLEMGIDRDPFMPRRQSIANIYEDHIHDLISVMSHLKDHPHGEVALMLHKISEQVQPQNIHEADNQKPFYIYDGEQFPEPASEERFKLVDELYQLYEAHKQNNPRSHLIGYEEVKQERARLILEMVGHDKRDARYDHRVSPFIDVLSSASLYDSNNHALIEGKNTDQIDQTAAFIKHMNRLAETPGDQIIAIGNRTVGYATEISHANQVQIAKKDVADAIDTLAKAQNAKKWFDLRSKKGEVTDPQKSDRMRESVLISLRQQGDIFVQAYQRPVIPDHQID